jgi:16S rRNA (cytidine1402-2'-O)-methyltransferase
MGTLYLLPTLLSEGTMEQVLSPYIKNTIKSIQYFIVENVRTTRRFISALNLGIQIDDLTFFELNKHTPVESITGFLEPLQQGNSMGLLSEAGLPGIADPGSEIVKLVHRQGLHVKPLTGPSSIFLALMASGLNGQNFAFNGYLPIQKSDRLQAIRKLEKRSRDEQQSQIFMEAPYRNNQLLEDILKSCKGDTFLCIAADLTSDQEFIKTKTVDQWKKKRPALHKRPCIFILQG